MVIPDIGGSRTGIAMQFAETLGRLSALCGPEQVGTPVQEASFRPDAFEMKTPGWGAHADLPSENRDDPENAPGLQGLGGWLTKPFTGPVGKAVDVASTVPAME